MATESWVILMRFYKCISNTAVNGTVAMKDEL